MKARKTVNERSRIIRASLAILLLALFICFICAPVCTLTAQAQAVPETIQVDLAAPAHPFPHFWEQMFGSGRAILSLRDSYRQRPSPGETGHRLPIHPLPRDLS